MTPLLAIRDGPRTDGRRPVSIIGRQARREVEICRQDGEVSTSPSVSDHVRTRSVPDEVVAWLLEGDPAIRWQVRRDLLDEPDDVVARERALVATEGWGAELLSRQDPDGRWAGAFYNPKFTSTTYTLLQLSWLGLPPGHPAALRGVAALWDGAEIVDGGLTFSDSTARYPEACISSMVVLVSARSGYADPRVENAVDWLVGQQLDDGGWNCEAIVTGSRHSSFHTSISALDALQAYREAGGRARVDEAVARGQRFFLEHGLYRSHRTGEVVDPAMRRFPFPPQWRFDVLRGLEHFRAAGAERDIRLTDPVEQVRRRRRADGRWPYHRPYPGHVWFEMEEPGPSRWATLRALRALRWWDERQADV
jgi:hypothetical protein